MSLVRAFTTRKSKKNLVQSSAPVQKSQYAFPAGTIRNKISAPVELLSTTNMLSYNAPDLYPTDVSSPPSLIHSSGSSTRSISDEELSVATPPASPQPERTEMPSPKNHLTCYFETRDPCSGDDSTAPVIPQRSPSHTKRTHEIVHRKRSIHRMSGQLQHKAKASISTLTRDSLQMFSPTPEIAEEPESVHISSPPVSTPTSPSMTAQHPFGSELAQLTELAEEVSSGSVQILDEEELWLAERGLHRFDAQDYMNEIQSFYDLSFDAGRKSIWI